MKRTLSRRVFVVGSATLALAGCGGGADADEPPKVSYGSDICARCRMIISEERHAAGLVADDGSKMLFDDTGELIATVQDEGLNGRRVWVHDNQDTSWIDGESAYFVSDPEIMTPMGTGVVAFKDRGAADAFAQSRGTTAMTWGDILINWQIDKRMS